MGTLARSAALAVLLGVAGTARAADPEVALFRIADEGSLSISGARASRGAGAAATVVVVLESARGDRLFLRRAQADGGAVQHFASLGGPSGVSFTRRGDATRLEGGGSSLDVVEGELSSATARCWVRTRASRVDPKLLDGASAVRLLRDATGSPQLEDVYLPMSLLWQVADPSDLSPRGNVRLVKGPFAGEAWERLARAAADEVGER